MKALLKNINLGEIAAKSVGHAGGLAVTTQINRIPAIKKIDKPALKGTIMAAIGYVAIPMLLSATGVSKKKGFLATTTSAAADAVGIYGIGVLANSFAPNIFPAIAGYEDQVYGMGLITEEDEPNGMQGVNGYETGAYDEMSGTEDDEVGGLDDDEVGGLDDDDL